MIHESIEAKPQKIKWPKALSVSALGCLSRHINWWYRNLVKENTQFQPSTSFKKHMNGIPFVYPSQLSTSSFTMSHTRLWWYDLLIHNSRLWAGVSWLEFSVVLVLSVLEEVEGPLASAAPASVRGGLSRQQNKSHPHLSFTFMNVSHNLWPLWEKVQPTWEWLQWWGSDGCWAWRHPGACGCCGGTGDEPPGPAGPPAPAPAAPHRTCWTGRRAAEASRTLAGNIITHYD